MNPHIEKVIERTATRSKDPLKRFLAKWFLRLHMVASMNEDYARYISAIDKETRNTDFERWTDHDRP